MASSKEILNCIRMTAHLGTVRWVQAARAAGRDPRGPRSVQFARDLAVLAFPQSSEQFVHPEDAQPARDARSALSREASMAERSGAPTGPRELSAADLVWLQRLPQDPNLVNHNEASRVAGLDAAASKLTPSSRHLVESIWAPIKELHDLRAAKHELQAASRTAPQVPASTLDALVEALTLEHRDWPSEGVRAHASAQLDQAIADRNAQRADAKRKALDRVTALDRDAADRVAFTRSGVK